MEKTGGILRHAFEVLVNATLMRNAAIPLGEDSIRFSLKRKKANLRTEITLPYVPVPGLESQAQLYDRLRECLEKQRAGNPVKTGGANHRSSAAEILCFGGIQQRRPLARRPSPGGGNSGRKRLTMSAPISEEEWSLLANAVTTPIPQLIAVETVDSAQMAEASRRLTALAGARMVQRIIIGPGDASPEEPWRLARKALPEHIDPRKPPFLLLEFDTPAAETPSTRQRQADYWRGMNQLREHWHGLGAQTIFLLSPVAFQLLSLHADHLKRWMTPQVRLWPGSHDPAVLDRPGRAELAHAGPPKPDASRNPTREHLERQRLALLARQYEQQRGSAPATLFRHYLLPLIEGHLALGEPDQARAWREQIENQAALERTEREALAQLDERLQIPAHPAFDVFLSHNSRDKPAVRELANALRERGVIVWLDEDELRPGLNWQSLIEAGIKQSASVAVLIGNDGLGPWEDEEMQGALIHAVKDGSPVIPVVLPDAPSQPTLPMFLGTRTWVDLRPAMNDDNLGRLIWGITGKKSNPAPVAPAPSPAKPAARRACSPLAGGGAGATNPYDPWNPATPPRFFGRDKLLRRLGEALDQGRSVSLVGDWRIGKSSVLATWAEMARQRGRVVSLVSGEGPEAESCRAFVEKITGRQDVFGTADSAADELSDWAETATLPPLILVDEAERLLTHLPHRFFERLRGMLGRVCLVFASRREIGEITRDDHLTSPLLNRLELQRLGLLENEGVNGLLGLGAGVLSEEDAGLMREWAGRHPFYLALLGHYLWDARRHGGDVEEALEEFQEHAYKCFEELWQALTELEQQHLLGTAIPMLRAAFALTNRNNLNLLTKPGTLQAAATSLKRRGLLDDGQVFGRVLTEWLKQRP